MNNIKILLVDDEPDIIEFLSYNLNKEGYQISSAINGEDGLAKAREVLPHLILLDVMMPGLDGIEVCKQLKKITQLKDTMVVFLTARSESFTQVSALEAGADDFIVKPIMPNVLSSKIKALLRRHPKLQAVEDATTMEIGDLVVDFEKYLVWIKGNEIALAKKEFELLKLLLSKPGKVFQRAVILNQVWGGGVIVGDRTIDVHVRKLREKIGNNYIQTMKGVGYKFNMNL